MNDLCEVVEGNSYIIVIIYFIESILCSLYFSKRMVYFILFSYYILFVYLVIIVIGICYV